ncbi:MAG: hemerythrin domain-containing protein [Candidatus Omnitrophica bacterium]|nr:hemerythrin domain-containing protein [Candidatus Omnitrophota bacterium]
MNFILKLLVVFVFSVLSVPAAVFSQTEPNGDKAKTEAAENIPVSPVEDLMREHGALSRVLLIYEEIAKRLDKRQDIPDEALDKTTLIIRAFIQDYHEKLEEKYVFPRLRNANKLVPLVNTLEEQHRAGRRIIDSIMKEEKPRDKAARKKLAGSIRQFILLYRPHKSREDTILFPEFHSIVPLEEYNKLGEEFEDREHELFGEEGFTKIVDEIAGLEKELGIYDLSQFTPKK